MRSAQQHGRADSSATLAAARGEYLRSILLRLDTQQLRPGARVFGGDDRATATAAMAHSAVVLCSATAAKLSKLQNRLLRSQAARSELRDLLRQNQARLRASEEQRAVLAEQVQSLTALCAEKDADIQAMSQTIEELNAEIQQGYRDEAKRQAR